MDTALVQSKHLIAKIGISLPPRVCHSKSVTQALTVTCAVWSWAPSLAMAASLVSSAEATIAGNSGTVSPRQSLLAESHFEKQTFHSLFYFLLCADLTALPTSLRGPAGGEGSRWGSVCGLKACRVVGKGSLIAVGPVRIYLGFLADGYAAFDSFTFTLEPTCYFVWEHFTV